MSTAGTVEVLPDRLSKAADEMYALAGDMDTIVQTLFNTLASVGTPWGQDSYGDKFANGTTGYLAVKQNLIGDGSASGTATTATGAKPGAQGLAATLRSFGDGMTATVQQANENEQTAVDTFQAA
ncbi:hypothetical protein KO481_28175 [Nocardia sp. NEAU-G5]|uniref:WXG100 family type VII secretion target n=1 Tax=Nocardia albiluteola TaxID=2842303 RepID=A0ABS6B502_9NOCA|nr:hypothetical protein [Nocardia albiluteola]MBU3065392.1 hypothetical protein [Nocardia albiluteola]